MLPFERTSTACSASFGPIARAASSPVAPSGSSSSDLSGRTTFMSNQNTEHPREDDRNDELDESPGPRPRTGQRRRGRARSGLVGGLSPDRSRSDTGRLPSRDLSLVPKV